MGRRTTFFIAVQIIAVLTVTSTLYSWEGNIWEPIDRNTILKIADEMIDFSWSPKNTITNWSKGSTYRTFYKGTIYKGEAYSQTGPPNNDQANWAEFYSYVNNTTGGTTYYGNDCSGFVSMSWRLPVRYTTTDFENDAVNSGGYVASLGNAKDREKIGLLLGDAFVKSGTGAHVILFEKYYFDTYGNKIGIQAMEQTPPKAKRKKWTWDQLASYRPIRRNNIDEGNYVFKTKWGSGGDGDGQFGALWGIAVGPSGEIYVADTDNNRIQKFNSSGGFLTKWGSYGTENGQFDNPYGVAVDFSGNVYVSDSNNNRVQKFNGSGCFLTKWGSYGSGNGQFDWPYFTSVGLSGKVYVADAGNSRIQKFNSSGGFLTKWGSNGSDNGQFDYPIGIAVDSSENIFVADTYNNRVQQFNSNGDFLAKWGSFGTGNGQFRNLAGIAVDSSLNVYVADIYNYRIQKFSPVSPLPSEPSNLTATALSSSQIKLSWKDNSTNETGFKIKRKTGVTGTYSTIATVDANVTSYTDSGLTGGKKYYYAVWAYNDAGLSAYSNEAKATTP